MTSRTTSERSGRQSAGRGRRPQGSGRRAYKDVFTASHERPTGYRSAEVGKTPKRNNASLTPKRRLTNRRNAPRTTSERPGGQSAGRGRRPQESGRRAYKDVFTASRERPTGHQSAEVGKTPKRNNASLTPKRRGPEAARARLLCRLGMLLCRLGLLTGSLVDLLRHFIEPLVQLLHGILQAR